MNDATQTPYRFRREGLSARSDERPALAILWCRFEPDRAGEVALLGPEGGDARILGRGDAPTEAGEERLLFFRQRPGETLPTGPLKDPTLSRRQLRLEVTGSGRLQIDALGRCPLRIHGPDGAAGIAHLGDLIELEGSLVLRVVRRPLLLPAAPGAQTHPFGRADEHGVVGESPAAWELRRQVAFVAPRRSHVLLLGPSGSGKELVAQAIHGRSARRGRPLISRNAATFPEALVDAELFGNARNYPNAGMPERPGLIGQADGSTLFLDEIGELPIELQAHLLRVMDRGEFQRLGEGAPRRADVRIVAATNRDPASLKEDLLARFPGRILLPGLGERMEDVPLIIRHLLKVTAEQDAELAARFWEGDLATGHPRLAPDLIVALATQPYTTHVRQLGAWLWEAMMSSRGDTLDVPPSLTGLPRGITPTPAPPRAAEPPVDPSTIPVEAIQAALDRNPGSQEDAARELGLASRFVLYRLIRKHGLTPPRATRPWEGPGDG